MNSWRPLELLLRWVANLGWVAFQSVNQFFVGKSFRPPWAPAPLLKSWERSAPPFGWPRTTDSLCPGCVKSARKRILARINRLRAGNFGDCEAIGGGILELRVDYGPGYRVYCARDGQTVVVLLCGGEKSRQQADIEMSKRYWQQYKDAR